MWELLAQKDVFSICYDHRKVDFLNCIKFLSDSGFGVGFGRRFHKNGIVEWNIYIQSIDFSVEIGISTATDREIENPSAEMRSNFRYCVRTVL